jgi:hypothetical protein
MIALGEEPGTLRLFVPPLSERRDYNVTYIPRADWLALDVACRKLDECVAEWDIRNIDLMKMDVEGAEPRVLAGGAESLRSGIVKHLIVEVNGPRLSEGGSSPEKLIAQLAGLGFLPARIVGKRVVTISADRWDLDPAHEYDRLFVHNSIQ